MNYRAFALAALLAASPASARSGDPRIADPDQPFVSIRDAFPDPGVLATVLDAAGALARLRELSSPTAAYHRELVEVARGAGSLDVEHLMLLEDAVFVTWDDERLIASKTIEARKTGDAAELRKLDRLAKDGDAFGSSIRQILMAGIPKLGSLSLTQALELLSELFPDSTGANDAVFDAARARLGTLEPVQDLILAKLAREVGAWDSAGALDYDWFRRGSDGTLKTLLYVAANLQGPGKDRLIESFADDLRAASFPLIEDLASAAGTDVARASVILKLQKFLNRLTAEEYGRLVDLSGGSPEVAVKTLDLAGALDTRTVVVAGERLPREARAGYLVKALPLATDLSLAAVLSASAGFGAVEELAWVELARDISMPWDTASALQASALYDPASRDSFLLEAADRVTDLDATKLEQLVAAAQPAHQPDIRARGQKRLAK